MPAWLVLTLLALSASACVDAPFSERQQAERVLQRSRWGTSSVYTPARTGLADAARTHFGLRAEPVQPFAYSHRVHLAQEMACTDCHQGVETGPRAGLPGMNTCMTCHAAIASTTWASAMTWPTSIIRPSRSRSPIAYIRTGMMKTRLEPGIGSGNASGQFQREIVDRAQRTVFQQRRVLAERHVLQAVGLGRRHVDDAREAGHGLDRARRGVGVIGDALLGRDRPAARGPDQGVEARARRHGLGHRARGVGAPGRDHLVAQLAQPLGRGRADEAAATDDEDLHDRTSRSTDMAALVARPGPARAPTPVPAAADRLSWAMLSRRRLLAGTAGALMASAPRRRTGP